MFNKNLKAISLSSQKKKKKNLKGNIACFGHICILENLVGFLNYKLGVGSRNRKIYIPRIACLNPITLAFKEKESHSKQFDYLLVCHLILV